jgi:tRNA dimethylallyltransferase
MPYNSLVILGATASGKTKLACQYAKKCGGEVISIDSRQVYRNMDIGTGKDLVEYTVDNQLIKYHLIDIKDAGYKYNIEEFQRDFKEAFQQVQANGNLPILCGGSGLYLETALNGNSYLGIPNDEDLWVALKQLSPEALEKAYLQISPSIRENLNALTDQRKMRAIEIAQFLEKNPNWKSSEPLILNPLLIGIELERELRREKITKRLSYRLNHGLIGEVENLLTLGLDHADLAYYGLEYKWISKYLLAEISKRELFENLNIAIHQFAKKQMTWFRRMEKNGAVIHWLDAMAPLEENIGKIDQLFNAKA